MAVSKARKSEVLAQLEEELKASTSVAFTSNTKLTVEEISAIRRDLRQVNAKFMLAKKTLIRIAFKNVFNVELNEDIMPGQVAVLINKGDKIAGFSVVNKYAFDLRKDEKIKFVGAYLDGEVFDAAGATRLATIPSREVLLAKLLGSMMSPLSALARFLDAAKKDIESKGVTKVGDLAAFAKKEEAKTEEKAPEAPAAETAPEAPATEEAAPAPEAEATAEAPAAE